VTDVPDRLPDPAALDELSRAFDDGDLSVRDESDSSGPRVIRIADDLDADAADLPHLDEVLRVGDAVAPGGRAPDRPDRVDPGDRELPTVVIVEDELLGEVDRDGAAVAGPAGRRRRRMEPRLRQRRIAIRRLIARRRLYWTLVAGATALGAVVALAVLGSPLFAIRAERVVVTGAVYTDEEALDEVLDDLVGTPSLRVDTRRLEQRLEAIPWVERARVRTDFPYGASVEIRERGAMTTYQGPDGRFRVLDRDGRVLDVIDGYAFAYVLLVGPDPVDLEPGMFAPVGYAAASELAKNLTPAVRGRVDRIDVRSDGSQLIMMLDDGSEVNFGEARDFFAKLLRLETVLAFQSERTPGPIDVSTADVTS
jgi:cell division protein FtsQ